ncbi:Receptor-like protein kinase FERONIA [Forsythia ovata]|uniref:Receptor-like protein kinase FERONIA n=1 Tax=Forsythia ovata TaxID=205694 RepID=A0ABD1UDH9_9LAMI
MYLSSQGSILKILFFFFDFLIILASAIPTHYSPPDNIAISCGSSGNSTALDGRVWIGDSGSVSPLFLQSTGKFTKSRAINQVNLLDSVPYQTARISHHEFSYAFPVNPGQKFIRLHFYQASYRGFRKSKALFTVKAGAYTLLSNFSTALTANALSVKHFSKEFCINVEENQVLIITFSPSPKMSKSSVIHAYINGIEIVSMPTGLYFTPAGDLGGHVVGQKYNFYIDNSTALEMVQRLNIGGNSISAVEDCMFRRWDEDSNYLLETGAVFVNKITTNRYRQTLTYIAPLKIYQTARSMKADQEFSTYNLTWNIPVNMGFRYLIRLHFGELEYGIAESGKREISIVINNQIVEDNTGIDQWAGASKVAAYRDYIVPMEGDKMMGMRNLTISFRSKFGSRVEPSLGILNGLEVFKLSNPDNSLAGMGPVHEVRSSTSTPQQKKQLSFGSRNSIATALTIIVTLLNIAVYHLRSVLDTNSGTRNKISSSREYECRQFSINEIQSSTNNFDPKFLIGSGGYGKVYKGSIDGGSTAVAIKRLKSESRQGDNEFWTEIKMLSKFRHEHLVSLIGFCNDGQERLLIYQYMAKGTVSDHLYKLNRNGRTNPPLSWELRLKISIGAARGLYYLHSRHRVIHRDVKSSNILLDENWIAKISDFGLSKMGPANDSFSHISTNVKGTFGYLDPEYFLTRKLTRKSDVYAFGVVLFEILSGRPAIDIRLEEEQHSLAGWARHCVREGKVDRLIDHSLMGQISPACLKVFVGIAGRCLHTQPHGRPAMADVVMSLELALVLQQNKDSIEQVEEDENVGRTYSDQSDGVISMDDISISPPKDNSERATGDEIPGSSPKIKGSDQKNAKTKRKDNSNSNLSQRWWWDPFGVLPRTPSKTKASPLPQEVVFRHYSLQEIQKATNNFHISLFIGYGGSDDVYKGYIDGVQKVVAIRRSRTRESRLSMANELQSKKEIQMQPSPSQDHVTSLIGYCDSQSDMMLVYAYMTNGTLHEQLHDPCKDPLPWKRRLQICIGAARGLSYLQSIIKQTTLHRDFKSTNIWLDENWVPEVSEWGLSRKKGNNSIPMIVRGNWGYLDSDFVRDEQLTEKSYIYSFGMVLFEVLCADKTSDRWSDEDQVSLAHWIKSSMRSNLSGCIDPYLAGKTSTGSLKIFMETAGRCLLDRGTERPSMNEIVAQLEAALKQQEAADSQGTLNNFRIHQK